MGFQTAGTVRATIDTSGNLSIANGNLVIGTAGKGIDFSADSSAAGMTSELLDDYEEGEWTPTDSSGASLTFSTAVARYTKIGRTVFIEFRITYPTTASTAIATIGSLPFTNNNNDRDNVPVNILSSGTAVSGLIYQGDTIFGIVNIGTFTDTTNVTLSGITIRGSGWYVTA
jgi:hypothetical protein